MYYNGLRRSFISGFHGKLSLARSALEDVKIIYHSVIITASFTSRFPSETKIPRLRP